MLLYIENFARIQNIIGIKSLAHAFFCYKENKGSCNKNSADDVENGGTDAAGGRKGGTCNVDNLRIEGVVAENSDKVAVFTGNAELFGFGVKFNGKIDGVDGIESCGRYSFGKYVIAGSKTGKGYVTVFTDKCFYINCFGFGDDFLNFFDYMSGIKVFISMACVFINITGCGIIKDRCIRGKSSVV